ncbi:hypothetical protein Patl1_17208 [Pistacia atlantica]|uniref:Uncharacterized protein n=1 Tax=Pistacia atlantica TaxID=434234 RepID=A0ACC1B7F6_9ROSI|nr:hypothetical protein Patl1_17208 [Pistacia atlantica]
MRDLCLGLEIIQIALPAALALAADPIDSLIDTAFIGRLGAVELAAGGVSIAIFNQASKTYHISTKFSHDEPCSEILDFKITGCFCSPSFSSNARGFSRIEGYKNSLIRHCYGLMGIFDGSKPSPPQFSRAENKTQVISTIFGLETSRLAWQALGARSFIVKPYNQRRDHMPSTRINLVLNQDLVTATVGPVFPMCPKARVVLLLIFSNHCLICPPRHLLLLLLSLSRSRSPCQICKREGHQALDCFNRMNYSFQGRHPPTDLAAMVAEANTTYLNQNQWYADSGANIHVTSNIANHATSQPYDGDDLVGVGNGTSLVISQTGTASIQTSSSTLKLNNVAYCPQASAHLLSINKFCKDNNVLFELTSSCFSVKAILTGGHNFDEAK